jgi:carbamoyl-phosphate synthase large subunit
MTSEGDRTRPVNVLVAAAGRRSSLVRAFVTAAHARGGTVLAGDVDGLAPALYLADRAVRTLGNGDPGFLADLVGIVERYGIGLLVPTIDTDLPVLAAGREAFEAVGCRLAVSSASFVATTLDKVTTGATFGAAGVAVPQSWVPPIDAPADLPATVFVKPRQGSASKDTYQIATDDLDRILGIVPDPVVQEVLTGPEITIDALLGLDGRPIHFVPRIRIKTLGGESVQGVTLDHDDAIETWIERVLDVCAASGAIGPLTLQAFLTPTGPVLSEINARFGGGFPLALEAGGDYPAWLLDMVAGRPVEPRLRAYEPGVYMTRSHVEHFTRRPLW